MILFLRHRSSFAQIFQPHPPEETATTVGPRSGKIVVPTESH